MLCKTRNLTFPISSSLKHSTAVALALPIPTPTPGALWPSLPLHLASSPPSSEGCKKKNNNYFQRLPQNNSTSFQIILYVSRAISNLEIKFLIVDIYDIYNAKLPYVTKKSTEYIHRYINCISTQLESSLHISVLKYQLESQEISVQLRPEVVTYVKSRQGNTIPVTNPVRTHRCPILMVPEVGHLREPTPNWLRVRSVQRYGPHGPG